MVEKGLSFYKNKNVLLLQGPLGPFFRRLALDLQDAGATVYKINLNGGDWFFSPKEAVNYTGSSDEWPSFFAEFIQKHTIDVVLLFGDCRAYHRIAHTIATNKGIDVGVFEEGYVRPDYITFEHFGVNGFSQIPRNREFYDSLEEDDVKIPETSQVGSTFWYAAWQAIEYYFFSALLSPVFSRYRHHRPLNIWEGAYWIRSLWRKWFYKAKEIGVEPYLIGRADHNYFLVPLQISTDAQVREHSTFNSVEHFIERVMGSFASHAPKKTLLVIKHHPLDRGYHDYDALINRMASHYGISGRVFYIHDQHLPTLLDHTRGVVLINSTVGLSAIHHNAPLKACGAAIYDFEGLTYQGSLESFWQEAERFKPDRELYEKFRGYVVNHKQINGSFYRRLGGTDTHTGTRWPS